MGLIEDDLCRILVHFTFFYVIFRIDFREKKGKRTARIIICLMAWSISRMLGVNLDGDMLLPFSPYLLVLYFILYLLFDVRVVEMAVLGIGQWLILSMCETTVHVMLESVRMEETILETITTLLISGFLWIYHFSIGKKTDSQIFRPPVKIWCLLDAILLILTAMITFLYVMAEQLPNSKTMVMGKALSATGGILICILFFTMVYYYNRTNNYRMQKELAELQNGQQREYFLRLLKKEEETRKFRHDVINDLLELQNYYEKGRYEQMGAYLESTLGVIEKISKNSYDVGNDILNTVLNYYLQPVKEKYSIRISGYMDENLSIEQRDLCTLSANLIKNASEAVGKLDTGEIWITIKEGRQNLYIQVKNTFDGKLDFDKNGIPKTWKQDKRNHGIGIHNIKEIVKKYDGTYHAESADGIYNVEIYLKL